MAMWHAYHMAYRTTLILDDATRTAARQLAAAYGCSTSEAIRRAVVHQRDAMNGISAGARRGRVAALKRLFELFEGNDAAAEIRRLKAEDAGF
jgi:hypothetical protein